MRFFDLRVHETVSEVMMLAGAARVPDSWSLPSAGEMARASRVREGANPCGAPPLRSARGLAPLPRRGEAEAAAQRNPTPEGRTRPRAGVDLED